MKKAVCFALVLLLLSLSGCKSKKTDRAEETTAAAGESAGAPVENTQDTAAPAVSSTAASTEGAASAPVSGIPVDRQNADGQASAAPAIETLSKEELGRLVTAANDLTLGWLNMGFAAKDHFDQNDTYEKPVEEYTIPFIRISGADYSSVEELKAAVNRVYTADAAAIFDGFIGSMYEMHDGKLYADSAIGQGGDIGGVRAVLKVSSQSAEECRLQVDYICDNSVGGGVMDGYRQGDLVKSETLTLKKENGQWKFTGPVSIFGLYFNWYPLSWAD